MLKIAGHRVNFNLKALIGEENSSAADGERRSASRHITILRVALLHIGEVKELCVVRNISSGGLAARVYRSFEIGESLQVEFRSDERLDGVVKWVRGNEVGIGFPTEIDVEAVLTSRWATEDGRRQRLPRIELQCRCQLRVGSRFYMAELQDISQGGAKVQLRRPLEGSGDAILTLPDLGWLEGTIRWSNGSIVGLTFNERLPFEMLVRWIQERRRSDEEVALDAITQCERQAA